MKRLEMRKAWITVENEIFLRRLEADEAEDLFRLTDLNREYLKRWLPWLDQVLTPEDSLRFIDVQAQKYASRMAVSVGIFYREKLVGILGFNEIKRESGEALTGYWLDQAHQGKGILTKSLGCFLNNPEIKCLASTPIIRTATENFPSQKIAIRLGFKEHRRIEKAENLYGHWVDHIEWRRE